MPWEIEILEKEKVIHLRACGSMDIKLIKQMCSEAMGKTREHGFSKYLVDFREMLPELTTMTIHRLPHTLEAMGDTRESKTAMVISPDSKRKDNFLFFETVSDNRGFTVQLFEEMEAARRWLE